MNCMNLLLVILAIVVIVVVLKKMGTKEGFDSSDIQTGTPGNPTYMDFYLTGSDGNNSYSSLVENYY